MFRNSLRYFTLISILLGVFGLSPLVSSASDRGAQAVAVSTPATLFATDTVTPITPLPNAGWEIAIANIEAAKAAGKLSIDEAALLRLQALIDVQALPAEFRPTAEAVAAGPIIQL